MMFRLVPIVAFWMLSITACKSPAPATEGSKSARKKVLTEVRITAIKVVQLPLYGLGGEKWDAWAPGASEPDVYVRISQFDQEIYVSETREECDPAVAFNIIRGLPFSVRSFTQPIRIEVFDEDGISPDDNIGYFELNLMDYKKKNAVQWQNALGELKMEIGLEWVYE